MARPQILQELRHGKLLTKENFPQFVDTFNYTVKRLENLKGDADTRPNGGWVTVDNTDPEHPVIRLKNTPSVVGGGAQEYKEPWTLDFTEDDIYCPMFQIGTYRDTAKTDEISISAWPMSQSTKHLYCVMDIANLSAYASETERNDWNHVSLEVATLSAISVDTGEVDPETGEPVIDYQNWMLYRDRYPIAPVWESFYN